MKRILAVLMATVATLAVLPASPAVAAQSGLSCTYDHGGVAPAGGHLKVEPASNDRHIATMYNWDSTDGRTWNWKLKHNGDYSAGGTSFGSGTRSRTTIDLIGFDHYQFVLKNANRTVYCEAFVGL